MQRLTLMTAAAALSATMAFAQQGNPGAHFIEQFDMDGDGQVTLAETKEKRGEVFAMFDSDEDGQFNAEEWKGINEHLALEMGQDGAVQNMGNGPGRFMHEAMTPEFNDANADGIVSAEEFVAATETLFANIDRNGDGVMTSADFGRP
jgi:Ca2+-binding EF-hand superfamily protein